ncbi:MFS transporter [Alsobacter metallidurans]|uniref:MFS transporter n=1 Tax=Alsobacter metallidurans TaxID=340221 RepID=A0A917I4I7_9HYPH|nr:tripartite tricarboxylate transporter substrate binding protein [Alsobacter metallidurans]GGH09268.1 MFS transporter [Alsobacter metallidurans]
MGFSRRAALAAAILCACAAPSGGVLAQGFPSRTITLVVPYPAGGPVDVVARLIAQEAGAELKQSIIVENRAGASGIVGSQAVARAEPDGYTLVLGTNQTHATNQSLLKTTPYDAARDFAPVAGVADIQHVLVARKDLPAETAAELVKLAKDKPGALTYGSTGNGSASHLAAELFKTRAGIDLLHVPFKGAAPMTTELLAGRIDVAFATLPSVISQIEGGELKALAVASATRAAKLPTVATLGEQGVSGVEADAWFALFAPARTPDAVVETLYKAVAAGLAKPAAQDAMARQGLTVAMKTPQQLGAMIPGEITKWAEVIRISGAKVD